MQSEINSHMEIVKRIYEILAVSPKLSRKNACVKQPPFITNKLSAIVLISEIYLIYGDNPTHDFRAKRDIGLDSGLVYCTA